jgi:hypothetical protein
MRNVFQSMKFEMLVCCVSRGKYKTLKRRRKSRGAVEVRCQVKRNSG